jgi:hypothetical protein
MAVQIPVRRLLFSGLVVLLLMPIACTNREEKMDAIEKSGYVIWFDKKFKVKKIDRPNEAVFIIEPDGVAIAVALEMVKPVEGP